MQCNNFYDCRRIVKRTFAIRFRYLLMNAVRIPLTHRLVFYTLNAGDCLFCVQTFKTATPDMTYYNIRT